MSTRFASLTRCHPSGSALVVSDSRAALDARQPIVRTAGVNQDAAFSAMLADYGCSLGTVANLGNDDGGFIIITDNVYVANNFAVRDLIGAWSGIFMIWGNGVIAIPEAGLSWAPPNCYSPLAFDPVHGVNVATWQGAYFAASIFTPFSGPFNNNPLAPSPQGGFPIYMGVDRVVGGTTYPAQALMRGAFVGPTLVVLTAFRPWQLVSGTNVFAELNRASLIDFLKVAFPAQFA